MFSPPELNQGDTPAEVTEQLQRFIDTGVDHLMYIFNFGAMPMDES